MRLRKFLYVAAAGALLSLAPASAADEHADLRQATADECRVASIPAHTRITERVEQVPPVYREEQVPVYATVQVPVYETRRVPVYETVEKPVYAEREIPIYRTQRVPVWGDREVTVYRQERKPVTVDLWNPFECEEFELELWDTCEQVPCGTRTVRAIVGHEEHRVPCGTRVVREQVGVEPEQILTGYREVREQTGTREERRVTGWTTRRVVAEPARSRALRTCVPVPCEAVTVVPDGTTRGEPLVGTSRVMTESEYRDALARIDAS